MKRIIDDSGRLFGRVSVIDIVVVVVAAVLAVAVYTKFNVLETPLTSSGTVTVTYTVKVAVVRETNAKLLRAGDGLYTDTGAFIGTIKDVETVEAMVTDALVDGTFAVAPAEDRFDVTLTVEADCSAANGRYYAGRTYELNTNAKQNMATKYNEFEGTIMTISAA